MFFKQRIIPDSFPIYFILERINFGKGDRRICVAEMRSWHFDCGRLDHKSRAHEFLLIDYKELMRRFDEDTMIFKALSINTLELFSIKFSVETLKLYEES